MKGPIVSFKEGCLRCGGSHDGLETFLLDRPIKLERGEPWTYWATCPATGDPLLFRWTREAPNTELGAKKAGVLFKGNRTLKTRPRKSK